MTVDSAAPGPPYVCVVVEDPGLRAFPGGHVEKGKTLEGGAACELPEETCHHRENPRRSVAYRAREVGYGTDRVPVCFWRLFDGKQDVKCREGQTVRFVSRVELKTLPAPKDLPEVWDLALAHSRIAPQGRQGQYS